MHVRTVLSLVVPALAFLGRVEGAPSSHYTTYESDFNRTILPVGYFSLTARQAAKPALRIMPLGASIVTGVGSSNGDDFRKPLRDQLRFKGWLVNMVGSKQNGVMVDRNFEANSGDTIDRMRDAARNSYGYKPNVVLLNAGTNDASAESNRKQINEQYKTMATRLKGLGNPIAYIDIDISLNELTDRIHPNDVGHKKMAVQFWGAIERAHQSGLIVEAAPFSV